MNALILTEDQQKLIVAVAAPMADACVTSVIASIAAELDTYFQQHYSKSLVKTKDQVIIRHEVRLDTAAYDAIVQQIFDRHLYKVADTLYATQPNMALEIATRVYAVILEVSPESVRDTVANRLAFIASTIPPDLPVFAEPDSSQPA